MQPRAADNRPTIALVLGILSFVGLGLLAGIPAWIIGGGYVRDADAGISDPSQRSTAQVGKVLGMITTILSILAVLFFIFMAGIFGLAATSVQSSSAPVNAGPVTR